MVLSHPGQRRIHRFEAGDGTPRQGPVQGLGGAKDSVPLSHRTNLEPSKSSSRQIQHLGLTSFGLWIHSDKEADMRSPFIALTFATLTLMLWPVPTALAQEAT